MADSSSTLSDTQPEMPEHLVDIQSEMPEHLVDNQSKKPDPEHLVDIDFNIAQSSCCCIYNVPSYIRKVNPGAYTPQLIAIGPIHHENSKLKSMEKEKERYSHFFGQRCQRRYPNVEELLQRYQSKLEEQKEQIRHSYAVELPDECSEKLVKIISLDAKFIMEFFLRFSSWKSGNAKCGENHDYMITRPWLRKSILRDLLLLENQIPMFVLEELYDTVVVNTRDISKGLLS